MAINCGHCGGEHATVPDVRACWQGGSTSDADAGPAVDEAGASGDRGDLEPVTGVPDQGAVWIAAPTATVRPGPDALGRHAIVHPGQSVPAPWETALRIRIDETVARTPAPTSDRLRAASAAGERLVLEVVPDVSRQVESAPDLRTEVMPEALGPHFGFDGDELHHLLWSNSIDLRQGDARWRLVDLAVAAGARAVVPGDDAVGDVVLDDGTPVWLDGGPLRHIEPIDGVAVLHAVRVEHRALRVPVTNTSSAALAPDQLAAVTHAGGTARIIAPAGSGKTRVLTERARHLLTNWRLPPTAVSLVAFNKRAQEEMRERTADLPSLQVRTLNAIALAIVNGTAPFAPQARRWRTIDEPEVRRIIGDLVAFPRRRNSDPIAPWIEALSQVRLGLIDPELVEQRDDGDIEGFAAFWPRYRAVLERSGFVDFDDQIYRALLILLREPQARRAAQRACRTMLVDEFQDLTPAHLLLIRLLSAPGGAVFGVGDDDQTIYGYNGADPAWLIDFAEFFPGAGAHPLEVNYRCPAGIVDIADRLLRHNRRRVAKTIRAASPDPGGWSVVESVDPVDATVDAVRSAVTNGAAASDIAVLARVNAVLAPVQVALTSEGVPVAGGIGLEFVDRTSVRAVLAWLRLARPGRTGLRGDDLREALRRPSRSFHPRVADWIAEQTSVVDLFALAARLRNEKDADRLTEFAADIQTLQKAVDEGAVTSDIVFTLVDEIGLGRAVSGLDTSRRGMNRSSQGDDLTAIQHLAALHNDVTTFESWLRDGLAVSRSADGVTLATVHRVKGQEWPHVVVHHADAHQYPHRLADDVEEERRLFHVALTRAARHATVVPGPSPSPFIAELTDEPRPDRVVASHRPDAAPSPHGRGATATDPVESLSPDERRLFENLRGLRSRLADGKPAYTVFDNKTLAAIARSQPSTRQDLHRISGVGPAKLDKYGAEVLAVVADFHGGADG